MDELQLAKDCEIEIRKRLELLAKRKKARLSVSGCWRTFLNYLALIQLNRFHQRFPQSRQQAGDGNRPAILWPLLPIYLDPKLTVGSERHTCKLDFQGFVPMITLDRNSQACFHKAMPTKVIVNTIVHSQ
jgi:hypothetical protein